MTGAAGRGGTTGAGGAAGTAGGNADGGCAPRVIELGRHPLNLLLLLDRSDTMKMAPDGTSCTGMPAGCSKWDQSVAAVSETTGGTATTINWALKLFGNGPVTPSGSSSANCLVNPGATVPFASGSANAIPAALAATAPSGSSPIRAAETSAAEYLVTLTDAGPKFILLITDGRPNCASATQPTMADEAATILAVETAAAMGFPTFVVGFGTASNQNDDSTLMRMAEVGGTQRYYPVASRDELSTVLLGLSLLGAGGCVYPITPPPESARFEVRVGDQVVPPSSTDGWDFANGRTAVRFRGSFCDRAADGGLSNPTLTVSCL